MHRERTRLRAHGLMLERVPRAAIAVGAFALACLLAVHAFVNGEPGALLISAALWLVAWRTAPVGMVVLTPTTAGAVRASLEWLSDKPPVQATVGAPGYAVRRESGGWGITEIQVTGDTADQGFSTVEYVCRAHCRSISHAGGLTLGPMMSPGGALFSAPGAQSPTRTVLAGMAAPLFRRRSWLTEEEALRLAARLQGACARV